jgi:hypothetical protein
MAKTEEIMSKIPLVKNRYFPIEVLIKKLRSSGSAAGALLYVKDKGRILVDGKSKAQYLYLMNEKVQISVPDGKKVGLTSSGKNIVELFSKKRGEYEFVDNDFDTGKSTSSGGIKLWETTMRDRQKDTYKEWNWMKEYKPVIYVLTIMIGFCLFIYFFWTYGMSQGAALMQRMVTVANNGLDVNINLTYSCVGDSCTLLFPQADGRPVP